VLHYDFESSIGYWLTEATQSLHRTFNEELAPTGITYRQAQVMAWLVLEGELTLSELAARMLIERPTLVGILDRMERNGWIDRRECADDRRRKLIRVREGAEPVWERIVECMLKVRAQATTGLEPEEVDQLRELLSRIHANMTPAHRLAERSR